MKSLEAVSRNTADSIFARQNAPYLLDCLLEQRKRYTVAKRMQAGQSFIVFVFAVFSVISSAIGSELMTAIHGLLSVILLIVNKYYDRWIASVKQEAATIQQFFDVVLFSTAVGNTEPVWYYFPCRKDMAKVIGEYTSQERASVKNWYSDYSNLSGSQQVFYCQSENIRWNKKLIKDYQVLQAIFWAVVFLTVVISFFVFNPSFIKMICVCTWLVPVVEYAVSSIYKIKECRNLHEKMEREARTIEDSLCSDDIVSSLMNLQQKIYKSRCESVLIPDWFYSLQKRKYQKTEDRIARKISNS